MSHTDELTQLSTQVDALTRRVSSLRRQLRNAENASVELANDILMMAGDPWDRDESIDSAAVAYVRKLEDVATWAIGRMPMPGDDPRILAAGPEWADRAAIEPDEDRAIDGDPDAEVRYDADGRGWHVRPAA